MRQHMTLKKTVARTITVEACDGELPDELCKFISNGETMKREEKMPPKKSCNSYKKCNSYRKCNIIGTSVIVINALYWKTLSSILIFLLKTR